MNKIKNIILLALIATFFLNSCSSRHSRHRQHRQYGQSSSHMTPAHSMSDLDNQSRSVKPHLVYSYPKNARFGNASFVDLGPLKNKILNYINNIRAQGNSCGPSAPPLGWNPKLENAAVMHAQDMASKGFLGHMGSGQDTDPARKAPGQGSNFYERIIYSGYPIKPGEVAGEILTYTKYTIVGNQDPYANFTHAVDNFLRSKAHCEIMMNRRFHDMGVASYKDQEKMYWVIEFAEVNY